MSDSENTSNNKKNGLSKFENTLDSFNTFGSPCSNQLCLRPACLPCTCERAIYCSFDCMRYDSFRHEKMCHKIIFGQVDVSSWPQIRYI